MILTESGLFYLALALPFLAAVVAPFLSRFVPNRVEWLLALAPFGIFLHFLGRMEDISAGYSRIVSVDWVPALSVNFSFYIDGLSALFALLISGIGTLIIIYSGGYMRGHPQMGRFLSFMFLFMGAMLGLVLANNLITLFVFWELTSITSFLLIGFNHESERSRRAAIQALVVTGGGGLVMLAGLLLLGHVTQEFEMSALLQNTDILQESGWQNVILLLLLGGAFTKSAQFPFHFWLANAMEAPTPVSAYLHSATMVKAGVYLLMRINPLFENTDVWTHVLPLFGAVTLIAGSILAARQVDFKLMLAYTTIGSLGLLVLLIGVPHEKAIEGAVLYLFAHALFKGTLFMVVGVVDHEAGSRELSKVQGLKKIMPVTFTAACLAALSMGGLPPFFGFIAKEILYEGIWSSPLMRILPAVFVVIGNAFMLAIALVVALKPFLGSEVKSQKEVHEGPVSLLIGPVVLSVLGLASALAAGWAGEQFIQPAVSGIRGGFTDIKLQLTPHLGVPFVLSIVTIALGLLLYNRMPVLRKSLMGLSFFDRGPDKGFDRALGLLLSVASKVTGFIQFGAMKGYMTVLVFAMVCAMVVQMVLFGEWPEFMPIPHFAIYEWAVFTIAIIGLVAVLTAANGMVAIVSLGIQGFAVAIIFMLYGAPDLSFTQFMVETLSVVILALVMTRLNLAPSDYRSCGQKVFDGSLAVVGGTVLCLTLMSATQVPFNTELKDFFEEFSRVAAHGRNIVNVILVDYRGIDTLGEIAVVMIAGLAVLALVRIATPKDGALEQSDLAEADAEQLTVEERT